MKLYEHQKKALEYLTHHDSFALFMEQGTGKTFAMLYHVTNLLIAGDIDNCLIVSPLSSLGAWKRDMERLGAIRQTVLDKIQIVNYDKVWRRKEYDKAWNCIVLDEGHYIAHKKSKRTRFLLNLSKQARYRYVLTGTPIANARLEDYYTLLTFLIPNLFESYQVFASRYLIEKQLPTTFVKIITGYRNVDELLSIVGKLSYRVLKSECLDLPDKLEDEVIMCELKEKKIYKQAKKDFVEQFDMTIGNPLTKIAKLRQIPNGFLVDDYGELHKLKTDKLKMLEELITGIIPQKVVIFCEYKYSMNEIKNLLDQLKIKYVTLNGEQKNKQIWRQFQSDESIKIIIVQYLTGNAGIDLYSSSHMVFYEPNLSTTVVEQSRDRIHRIGVKHSCSYYWLITENTIEQDIYNRLKKNQDFNRNSLNIIASQWTKE